MSLDDWPSAPLETLIVSGQRWFVPAPCAVCTHMPNHDPQTPQPLKPCSRDQHTRKLPAAGHRPRQALSCRAKQNCHVCMDSAKGTQAKH